MVLVNYVMRCLALLLVHAHGLIRTHSVQLSIAVLPGKTAVNPAFENDLRKKVKAATECL